MPFGAHETMEVHEILNESINMINHFSLYAQQCQDPNLRQVVERHLQTALQSYHQLVGYTHDYQAAALPVQAPAMGSIRPQQIQYGVTQSTPHMPQLQGRLSDQQIVAAMLSCHKNSAKNHMHAAVEVADPNIRQMLINGAVTCANQAYELFLMMNQQGAYQVPVLQDQAAKEFLHSYQPVSQMS
ncbi:MAG TPA: spore coat protein [Bacillota bacterium]|nr:spore coat protein [Bacillota bacterium]